MTGAQIFFFFVLPLLITAGGWLASWQFERSQRRERHHPGE